MSIPYKKVLVVGATSGIGQALAEKFIAHGSKVIVSGRRQENIDALIEKHGSDKVSGSKFDVTNLSGVKAWAESVHKSHPDLDFVVLNSGIQRAFNFADPSSVDLSVVETEFTTNYLSYVHMAMAFLPYLEEQSKKSAAAIAFTTSGLALVPIARCANYCASKAALHAWILCLRQALKDSDSKVKCIELLPPAVQTELHDEKHQPDIKGGAQMGMPLNEYIESTWSQLTEGKDQIPVGTAAMAYKEDGFETQRQKVFGHMSEMAKKMFADAKN